MSATATVTVSDVKPDLPPQTKAPEAPAQGTGATAAGPATVAPVVKTKSAVAFPAWLLGTGFWFLAGVGISGFLLFLIGMYTNLNILILAAIGLVIGGILRSGATYLTLKANGEQDRYSVINGLWGRKAELVMAPAGKA